MERPISTRPLKSNSATDLQRLRSQINTSPKYQRVSEVWSVTRKQLFIDSLINGFDIPKLYFHELDWDDARADGFRYAVIDGKQRLEALWGFLEGKYPLSDEFEFLEEPDIDASGRKYSELGNEYAKISNRVKKSALDVVLVRTHDQELIEEMFSRLNEAVPLNAPEKRNAKGGPLPAVISELAQHVFFSKCLPFPNGRYRHLDIATKFLYLEHRFAGGVDGIPDTKKRSLDSFVVDFKKRKAEDEAQLLKRKCVSVLDAAAGVFHRPDPLLKSVGMSSVFYMLFRDGDFSRTSREAIANFENERLEMRARFRDFQARALLGSTGQSEAEEWANNEFVEFDRLMQSPNDGSAITYRLKTLKKSVRQFETR